MLWYKSVSRYLTFLFVGAFVSFISVGLMSSSASAANANVQGSYAAAMTFANQFCSEPANFNPSFPYDGLGDLVWITAPDGGTKLTANVGDQYARVVVNIAGKYCSGYSGSNAGSDYISDRGNIAGRLLYNNNGPNQIFHVSQEAFLYIGDMSAGTNRINMSLATFYTGLDVNQLPSPNAWTDIELVFNQRWTITGQSRVSVNNNPNTTNATAKVNDFVQWSHSITNQGPNRTDRAITYKVEKTGFVNNAWGNGTNPNNEFPSGSFLLNPLETRSTQATYNRYQIRQDDVGRTICQYTSYWDYRWDWPQNHAIGDPNYRRTTPACVTVAYNFNLFPNITGISGAATPGSTLDPLKPSIFNGVPGNQGGTTKTPDSVIWELKRVDVLPGGSITNQELSNALSPCAHYDKAANVFCTDKTSGKGSFNPDMNLLPDLANESVSANLPVGTKICFTLSVRPYSSASTDWRHSKPLCVTVSKLPKLQVWGGDVRVGGMIETGTSHVTTASGAKTFGSWVEYGSLSGGSNNSFASASATKNGVDQMSQDVSWHRMTFANTNNSYGSYTIPSGIDALTAQFLSNPSTVKPNGNISAMDSGTYRTNDLNFVISGGSIGDNAGKGKSIIIISTGTVTITGDINYTGAGSSDVFNTKKQLPQLVIIAKNINIRNEVSRIDAWLLTTGPTGVINTCSNVQPDVNLTSLLCDKQLTVNGPVATKRLLLRRTAGSDSLATAGTPAETFNLRPDAFIWAYGQSTQEGKIQTVYSVEMPPRF